jgi:hypothetical protein
LIGPQGGLGQDRNSYKIDFLQIPIQVYGCEEVIGERDFDIRWREGCQDGEGKIRDTGILFNGRNDELDFHVKIVTTFKRIVKKPKKFCKPTGEGVK